MSRAINIISFDVPYPPNYGGVIDVFYKIKALKKLEFDIYLHTFEYGKGHSDELKKYYKKIYYYKRKSNFLSLFSSVPYIVLSRKSKNLILNLQKNNYPICFEGLHTTYPLLKNNFKNRLTLVRTHNIEHNYYKGLAKSESNIFKKLFFSFESLKLKRYQSILKKSDYILTISNLEQEYFQSQFHEKAKYIPVFHQNTKITSKLGEGNFALYHGDLRVSDNVNSCNYLIEIFSKINYPLIISGSFKNTTLLAKVKKYSNISFYNCKTNFELEELVMNAQINILPTFQNTGIKLKLINALFKGRFCLVNTKMIDKTGLESLCVIANSEKQFIDQIKLLSKQKFTNKHILKRKELLADFDPEKSAVKIIDLLN